MKFITKLFCIVFLLSMSFSFAQTNSSSAQPAKNLSEKVVHSPEFLSFDQVQQGQKNIKVFAGAAITPQLKLSTEQEISLSKCMAPIWKSYMSDLSTYAEKTQSAKTRTNNVVDPVQKLEFLNKKMKERNVKIESCFSSLSLDKNSFEKYMRTITSFHPVTLQELENSISREQMKERAQQKMMKKSAEKKKEEKKWWQRN